MLPIRWDPFRNINKELSTLHREMDDLFRRTFGLTAEQPSAELGGLVSPTINAYTKGNTYYLEAELPGVTKKDLDVNVEGNVLTLRGERKQSKEVKEEDYFIREAQFGSFLRRMTLPEGVNTEQIHAKFEDGILSITMPIEKKAAGRKVMIEGPEEGKKKIH